MFGLAPLWIFAILILFVLSVLYEFYRTRDVKPDDVAEVFEDKIILQVKVPKQNEHTASFAEQMFTAIHDLTGSHDRSDAFLSFEVFASSEGIFFYVVCDKERKQFVEGQIYAQYPDVEIAQVHDYVEDMEAIKLNSTTGQKVLTYQIELQKDFIFPIKIYENFDTDPLAGILSALGKLEKHEYAAMQFLIRPIANTWQNEGKQYVTKVHAGMNPLKTTSFFTILLAIFTFTGKMFFLLFRWLFFPDYTKGTQSKPSVVLNPTQEKELAEVMNKVEKPGYELYMRIAASSLQESVSQQIIDHIVATLKQYSEPHLNGFKVSKIRGRKKDLPVIRESMWIQFKDRYMPSDTIDIVNVAELASLFHFPTNMIESEKIRWSGSRKLAAPTNLPTEGIATFARTNFRGHAVTFGIKNEDRERHMYIVGKTGSGKSTLLKNMVLSDIERGEGVALFDPQGDLVDLVLDHVPLARIGDVIVINPSDTAYPVSLNPFDIQDALQKDSIAEGLLTLYKRHSDRWSERIEYILRYSIMTMFAIQGGTMIGILRLLTDGGYLQYCLSNIQDPLLYRFWSQEFVQLQQDSSLHDEVIAPIQTMLGRILSSTTMRNMFGQEKATIDLFHVLQEKKILLVQLSQGNIGEENASFLGGMLMLLLEAAAVRRTAEASLPDYYVYFDEFQIFATNVFTNLLSQARKYKLCLTLAHQYIQQLDEDIQHAIWGNIGTLIAFVVGNHDAQLLEKEFAPFLQASDLLTLENYQIYIKETINGIISPPFSAVTIDEEFETNNIKQDIMQMSREKYGREQAHVEQQIKEWMMHAYEMPIKEEVQPAKQETVEKPSLEDGNDILQKVKNTHDLESQAQQLLRSSPFYLKK